MSGVDVSDVIRPPETPPIVPGRLRKPLVLQIDDAMPGAWCADLSRWLFEHRGEMVTHSVDLRGAHDFADLTAGCPDLSAALRRVLVERFPEALGPCGVEDFEMTGISMRASLMHRHCFRAWAPEAWIDQPQVRLSYELTLHTDPRMFSGGEREFLCGDVIEPINGRLVFLHPLQTSRIREIECWSRHALDGRWSVWGEILGLAPDGWAERVRRLLGS